MIEIAVISSYLLSALIILFLDYIFKKAITIQDIFIAFIPVINSVALIFGIGKLLSIWYKQNKNKVILQRKPRVKKKKVPKNVTLPAVEAFQIPTPRN